MTIETMLYAETHFACAIILLIIALNVSFSGIDTSRRGRMFAYPVWFTLAACLLNAAWSILSTESYDVPLAVMVIINSLYFLCCACATYSWFLYAELTADENALDDRMYMHVAQVPIVLLVLLQILTLFNGCVFWFDENMVYHRGPLFYVQCLLAYGYLIVAAIHSVAMAGQKRDLFRRDALLDNTAFIVAPLLFGTAQIFLHQLPLIVVGMVISFLLTYIGTLKRMISVDPLTGISNRRVFVRMAANRTLLRDFETQYLLFMDIDNFKYANDRYGHLEGDKALCIVADALSDLCRGVGGICCRYGGDEFAALIRLHGEASAENFIYTLQQAVRDAAAAAELPYNVEISVGWTTYNSRSEPLSQAVERTDIEMYEKKRSKGIHR